MRKVEEFYVRNLPLGAIIIEDIIDNGTLLIGKHCEVTSTVLDALKNYKGKVKVEFDIPDSVFNTSTNDNYVYTMNDDIKTRALVGVKYIHSSPRTEEAVDIAHDISELLVSSIKNSSSISIDLNKIKVSDDYTFKHCVDVATMSVIVAKHLGWSEKMINSVAVAGILHDIGKVGIPNEILNKPGKLTTEEFNIIKQHPVIGYEILKNNNDVSEETRLGVLEHHEKCDGNGYPYGKTGSQITLQGKLLGIVDVYDALVTKRPYRNDIITPAKAFDIIMSMYGQFDIPILNAFLSCLVIYPDDSTILMSDNTLCRVLRQNLSYPLRPVVQNVLTGEVIDLLCDTNYMSLTVLCMVKEDNDVE